MVAIVICLLLIAVAFLLHVLRQEKQGKLQNEDPLAGLPDIIGRPKISEQSRPVIETIDSLNVTGYLVNDADSEILYGQDENVNNVLTNLEEEEEEFASYASYEVEEGFATGVTFDELATAEKIFAQKEIAASDGKAALGTVSKIDGTELLNLLESRFDDASRKIASLLDGGNISPSDAGYSLLRDRNQDSFDNKD